MTVRLIWRFGFGLFGGRRAGSGTPAAPLINVPRYLLPNGAPTLIEGFGAASDWSATAGTPTIADNASAGQFSQGTQGVKVTSNASGAMTIRKTLAAPVSLAAGAYTTLDVYSHNAVSLSMVVTYWTTAGVKGVQHSLTNATRGVVGWTKVLIPKTGGSVLGGFAYASDAVNVVDIRMTATAGAQAVTYDTLCAGYTGLPAVSFAFHDGWQSHYTDVLPLFQARGLTAAVMVNTSSTRALGQLTWMSIANLQALAAAGWIVCDHGTDHSNYNSMANQAAVETDIATSRDSIINTYGIAAANPSVYGSYPGGSPVADQSRLAVIAQGYHLYHGSAETYLRFPYPDLPTIGARVMTGGTALATYQAEVDAAISTGSAILYVSHDVSNTGDITVANLTSLLDYVLNAFKGTVGNRAGVVLNYDELYRAQLAAITVPTPVGW